MTLTGITTSRAASRRDGSRRLAALLVLSCYLLAALAVTWRLWAGPSSRTVAGNPDDADLFAWYMRYAANAIAHGRLPALVSSALNAPHGVNLMWNSSLLLPCTVLAPVTLLFGPQVSLTVLSTAGFAGSAAAMYWVLRRWRVSTGSAALAGAVYGFSPALLHSAIGHYDLQLVILPPLIVEAGLRLAVGTPGSATPGRSPGWPGPAVRAGVWLGVLVAAELFISEELALTTVVAAAVLVLVLAVRRPGQISGRLRPAGQGLLVAVLVTLGLAGWALRVQFAGPLAQNGSPFLRDFYENDVTSFVTPSALMQFHTAASAAAASRFQGQLPEYLGYLGWPLIGFLVLAAACFWRRPAVLALSVAAAVFGVLSLGGHPLVGGITHSSVTLPWHWLEGLPLAGSVLPDRLSVLTGGAAAALLALLVDLIRDAARAASPRPAGHAGAPGVPGARAEQAGNPPPGAGRLRNAREAVRTTGRRPGGLLPRGGRLGLLATVAAVLACLPLLPRPLPAATAPSPPAGWAAALAALRLPDGARLLTVPVAQVHLTAPMRWIADTGQPLDLIGGYFIGPAWDGHAYVDGNGPPPTARYLDALWAAQSRPGSAAAAAGAAAGLGPPGRPPPADQVRADLAAWSPAGVVAATAATSRLGRYLIGLLGRPAYASGALLGWRLRADRSR